jgi:hypothetical protein
MNEHLQRQHDPVVDPRGLRVLDHHILKGEPMVSASKLEGECRAFPGGYFHLYGSSPERVVRVSPETHGRVLIAFPDGGRSLVAYFEAARQLNAYLYGVAVVEGATFTEWINQGMRRCEIVRVTPTRFRIEFDMPTCTQGGWRRSILVNGRPYYHARGWI